MNILQWGVLIWVVPVCLFWFAMCVLVLRTMKGLPKLSSLPLDEPEHWPLLSVVIPACDEEDTIEDALCSILEQDYPNLEILLIDDRSHDNTGEVIEKMAKQDPRIKPIHITHLPGGWLGKVHALEKGSQLAKGEWMLFTDADIHFHPGALRKAIAVSLAQNLDFLSLVPRFRALSFRMAVLMQSMGLGFFLSLRTWKVDRPNSSAYAGIGAFNMVRTEAFRKTLGFPWLKMEITDDVALSMMMHHSGAHVAIFAAFEELELLWYPTTHAMAKGLEKNLFGALGFYNYGTFVGRLLLFGLFFLGPFVAMLPHGIPNLWILGVSALLGLSLISGRFSVWRTNSFISGFLGPIGTFFIGYPAIRSAFLAWRQGGIVWRDTLYSIEQLKKGMRLRFLGHDPDSSELGHPLAEPETCSVQE